MTHLSAADLLARGYLPAELPHPFGSTDFGIVGSAMADAGARPSGHARTVPTTFDLVRPAARRCLSIPNPFAQLRMADACAEAWPTLDAHMSRSAISLSRPAVAADGRALRFLVPVADRRRERIARLGDARYTVEADVADFYGSVSTAAIARALQTARDARPRRSADGPDVVGAVLRAWLGSERDAGRSGLPLGPDTSMILSELILCSVDVELSKRFPGARRTAMRVVDDLKFAATSRAEAEDVLLAWTELLLPYGLTVNPRKTGIRDGSIAPEPSWRTAVSRVQLRSDSDRTMARDVNALFAAAVPLAEAHPTAGVVSHAVTRAQQLPMGPVALSELFALLLEATTTEPSALRLLARVSRRVAVAGAVIDEQRAGDAMNRTCGDHAALEGGSEVAWSLSVLRDLGLPVAADVATRVASLRDNCSQILLRDLSDVVARAEHPLASGSQDWLLAYEFARHGWASDARLQAEEGWSHLLDRDVAFFR